MPVVTQDRVPEGYEQLRTGMGFTDFLQPCYRKVVEREVSIGMLLTSAHMNTIASCHGGVLLTLADIAAATAASAAKGGNRAVPTINLSLDFISAAREGDWIQADIEGVSLKRLFGFSRGVITSSRGVVARFNGTFYFSEQHDTA